MSMKDIAIWNGYYDYVNIRILFGDMLCATYHSEGLLLL